MQDYSVTRAIGKLISFMGWAALLITMLGLLALLGIGRADTISLSIVTAGIFGSLLMVAQGQLIQAHVDTASNTGELIRLIREVSPSPASHRASEATTIATTGPTIISDFKNWDKQIDVERSGMHKGRRFVVLRDGRVRAHTLVGIQEFSSMSEYLDYVGH